MRNAWWSGSRGRGRPKAVLRILGPDSPPEIAARLLSGDGTAALVVAELSSSIVAPVTHEAVAWLQAQARADRLARPRGWKCAGRATP